MVIPSPGIPPYNEILTAAVARKIPVLSEIELAYRFLKQPVLAVTGTNGKTTTVSLLGEILAGAGKEVFVGGNIGNPLIEYAGTSQKKILWWRKSAAFSCSGWRSSGLSFPYS